MQVVDDLDCSEGSGGDAAAEQEPPEPELTPAERLDFFFMNTVKELGRHRRLPELYLSEGSALIGGGKHGRKLTVDDPRTTSQYAQIYSVAGLVMDLVKSCKSMSQRDVYYSLKSLFQTQAQCNKTIIDLGLILSLTRHQMNVYPSSKGLLAGPIRFRFIPAAAATAAEPPEMPPWQDCMAAAAEGGGLRITSSWLSGLEVQAELPRVGSAMPRPKYILVIEKEGIFSRLVEDEAHIKLPAILMTACGYPDVASRACLSRLKTMFPETVVLGLCDYNSYGLAVLLSYKLPTAAMRFEAKGMQCPSLQYLGLRTPHVKHLLSLGLERSHLQPMTERDKSQCRAMLRSDKVSSDLPNEYGTELADMLATGYKVELESLYSLGLEACCAWLLEAVAAEDYI